ncbi:A24 family peptidase [Sphingobium sp. H39-3-25]|uniref:prepilin peptidase n=1 Tax=Sphingobium arseniciresistens TaxID=3030834 RepID=UPI0023BA1282|nr:A24 family peptidase [Sphingobium arseniciresistens]
MTPAIGALLGAVLGAIAGSFLGTLALRWPQGRSVMAGRSACDGCGRTIGALELIPLLSAIALRWRCRTCGAGIDPLHWRMEMAMAAIGAAALGMAPDVGGLGWALLGWLLLTLAVLDWRHFWLPDALTMPLAFLGFTIGMWATDVMLMDRVIGAAVGYGALLAISFGYRAWRGREGLGLGDAKLLGALGAWMGWQALPFILLVASFTALIMVLLGRLRGAVISADSRVPLGTFLCLGALPGWLLMRSVMG